jgi:two-component system LytT family response regulator
METDLVETVVVKTGKRLYIIPISEILCFQAYGDYVNIMTLHGTHLKEQTLKYYEEHLPEKQFIRVHRSHIVNLNAIRIIERCGRDQYFLFLSNNEKIKATLEGYRRLKTALNL